MQEVPPEQVPIVIHRVEDDRSERPAEEAGCYSRLSLHWMTNLLAIGKKRMLAPEDLYPVRDGDEGTLLTLLTLLIPLSLLFLTFYFCIVVRYHNNHAL
jgi:hypothetical protein